MSLITSCPACSTTFRVVPDQLKISEGWVRCGHCGEVFDGTVDLRDESELDLAPSQAPAFPDASASQPGIAATQPGEMPTTPADLPRFAEPPRPADPPTMPADLETMPAELATRPAELPRGPRELRPRPTEPAAASSFFGDSQSLEPSPLDSPFVFRPSDLAGGGDPSVLPPTPRDSRLGEEFDEPTPAELDKVTFLREGRRKAFWRRPLVRVLLSLVALALAALLVVQLAYQDRDRLALAEPALRPALAQMCELLHCKLGAPRQIEAIVIDSSGFNRLRTDTYRLAFTLRNTARVQVAVPAMELTVTDAQDQPIARHVLLPSDFGASDADTIPPVTEWSRSVGVVVTAPSTTRIAGYRLLAFYP